MRYEIDQTLFAINFSYHGNTHGLYGVPLKYDNVQPTAINLIELKVTEHHRVPNSWGTKLEHDGFLLKDDKGTVFTNQYPSASYGQTTDTADRRFRLKIDSIDEIKEGEPYEYHLLSDTLASISEGIEQLNEPDNPDAIVKRNALIVLRDRIIEEFNLKYPQIEIVIAKERLLEGAALMHWTASFYNKPQ